MSDMTEAISRAENESHKKPYERPQLQQVGSVVDLTTGATLTGGESLGYS